LGERFGRVGAQERARARLAEERRQLEPLARGLAAPQPFAPQPRASVVSAEERLALASSPSGVAHASWAASQSTSSGHTSRGASRPINRSKWPYGVGRFPSGPCT